MGFYDEEKTVKFAERFLTFSLTISMINMCLQRTEEERKSANLYVNILIMILFVYGILTLGISNVILCFRTWRFETESQKPKKVRTRVLNYEPID